MSIRSSLTLVATVALTAAALPGAAMATATTPGLTPPAPAARACPGTFQVLNHDRIGTLKLPAGPYTITTSGDVTCGRAATLFNRFLQDWDGVLPNGWKVKGSGFAQGSNGFTVKPSSTPPTPPPPPNGQTCAGSFTLTSPDRILNLPLAAGNYSVQLLKQGSSLTCATATRQFSTFLDATYTTSLPSPWTLDTSTATFSRGGGIGFRIVNIGGGTAGGGKTQGSKCPGTFQVMHNDQINSLKVPAGNYHVYAIGNLSCRQVMNDFRLDLQKNAIPARNWTLNAQTATFQFLKTKGFRVEPVNGV